MANSGVRSVGRRSILLELQPLRGRTDWHIRRRIRLGDSHRDEVLTYGSLDYTGVSDGPRDLIADLRRICYALERQYQHPVAEGDPAPPPGDTGGQLVLPGFGAAHWSIPLSGDALDSSPPKR